MDDGGRARSGFGFIAAFGTALGGWLSAVCSKEVENELSAWYTLANICGVGITAVLGGVLLRSVSLGVAAGLLSAMVFLPALIFIAIPCPGPDQRLASESFAQFNRDILALLRRREVLMALLLFISPCGSFGMTNLLSGLGNDFHASARIVSLGGAAVVLPGLAGCLLFPLIANRARSRFIYLANGTVGGLFTLSLMVLPHAPWSFILALIGEFFFLAVSYSALTGIIFEVIGKDNPLAATTFTLFTASANIPVTYMTFLDGRGYAIGGLKGSLALDAAVSISACILLGLFLSRGTRLDAPQVLAAEPLEQSSE